MILCHKVLFISALACCDQLWYKHCVIPVTTLKENNPDVQKRLLNRRSVNNVPPCATINGLQFPEKPSFFDLNELKCRLLAPRLAFQKLIQAHRGIQLKINGNIVNVPVDIVNAANMFPRFLNDTSTIKVNPKRRLQYKSSGLLLNVIPNKVAEAAKWLVNHGNVYKVHKFLQNLLSSSAPPLGKIEDWFYRME